MLWNKMDQGMSKLASRFLAEPDGFHGASHKNPFTWFRQIDHLCRGAGGSLKR